MLWQQLKLFSKVLVYVSFETEILHLTQLVNFRHTSILHDNTNILQTKSNDCLDGISVPEKTASKIHTKMYRVFHDVMIFVVSTSNQTHLLIVSSLYFWYVITCCVESEYLIWRFVFITRSNVFCTGKAITMCFCIPPENALLLSI